MPDTSSPTAEAAALRTCTGWSCYDSRTEVGNCLQWIETQRNKAQKFCEVMKRSATGATIFF